MSKGRNTIKRVLHPILKQATKWYFSKPRKYSYGSVEIMVNPGVFMPHMTISTGLFLDYLDEVEIKGKKVLEIGCGCGILSLRAAQLGGEVTAIDINPKAVLNTRMNVVENNLKVDVIQSDLLKNVPPQQFDLVLINPPYYPKEAKDIEEQAWYCGVDFEYFNSLFGTVTEIMHSETNIYMILSQDCAIEHIASLAKKNNLDWNEVWRKKRSTETNFIYEITLQKTK